MFADGRTVPDGEVVRTQVCVVGGGPAGTTIAKQLGAAGIEVVLLERGGEDLPPSTPDTALNAGIAYDLDISRAFEVGGAVQRWRANTPLGRGFGRFRELEEIDFERREWVAHSGWPFGKERLKPYYSRARALVDSSWPDDDPEQLWDEVLGTGPFVAGSGLRTRVFSFVNPAVFPGGMWRSLKNSDRVLVLTHAAATEIRTETSPSSVSCVMARSAAEHGFAVEAELYVIASGGIETPRLLLASRDRQPEGLANGEDLVGRFFMEHPHYASGQMVPRSRDAFADTSHYDIHLHDGIPVQKKYTLPESLVRRHGLLSCTFRFEAKPVTDSVHTLRYSERATRRIEEATILARSLARRERPADSGAAVATALLGAPHLGRHVVNRARVRAGQAMGARRYHEPQMFYIRAMAEQAPNPASRVRMLDDPDELGVPRVALEWRMTALDRDSMRGSQEQLAEALRGAGHEVESLLGDRELPPALSGGMHHMGTTRMDPSPRQGVVDADARVHGVDNLFVAGSSVFPTVGYANPTLTILAMALRLADHVQARVKAA